MEIEIRERSGVRIIDLAGRLTFDQRAKDLYAAVRAELDAGHPWILLNMAQIIFLDSTGLGELVSCHTSSSTRDGTLKLLSPAPKLEDILRITHTYDLFEIYYDEDEAVESFQPKA